MGDRRRAADGIEPMATIDLTHADENRVKHLTDENDRLYTCPICMETPEQPVATACGHIFCQTCLTNALCRLEVCPCCKKDVHSAIRLFI